MVLLGAGCANAPADDVPVSAELRKLQERLPEFAQCMRENGVQDFPDPGANGVIEYYGDPDTPEFASATQECDVVLPEDRDGDR